MHWTDDASHDAVTGIITGGVVKVLGRVAAVGTLVVQRSTLAWVMGRMTDAAM